MLLIQLLNEINLTFSQTFHLLYAQKLTDPRQTCMQELLNALKDSLTKLQDFSEIKKSVQISLLYENL